VQHRVGEDMQSVRRSATDDAQQAAAQGASGARDLRPRGWAKMGQLGRLS
jgi:hypothetical protein